MREHIMVGSTSWTGCGMRRKRMGRGFGSKIPFQGMSQMMKRSLTMFHLVNFPPLPNSICHDCGLLLRDTYTTTAEAFWKLQMNLLE
jgi:hypothetical protein